MSEPGEIIICGKSYEVDHRVYNYKHDKGFSAYVPHRTDNIGEIYASDPSPGLENMRWRFRPRRSMGKRNDLGRLRQIVRQVVVHLDGCRDARMCFHVLHNQRGLSVHFMVDNDGTIYQTLDLMHCAFHAAGVNEISIGIEMQNRGDAGRYPNYYKEGRPTVTCRVHGHQFLAYDFTEEQYEAMTKLSRTLTRIFDVPLTSPMASGQPLWTKLDNPRAFRGFVGHYHLSTNKWDPGPWDFQRLFRGVGSTVTFPLTPPPKRSGREDKNRIQALARKYYDNSEQDVDGHFPVGPLGRSRLWHGGLHLAAQQGSSVYAAFRGTIVAARFAQPCPVGSCNFVLLRHQLTVGKTSATFFSLYYHLGPIDEPGALLPRWLKSKQRKSSPTEPSEGSAPDAVEPWRASLERGEVALLGMNVEAAEVIGSVGEAGPSGSRESQIHFAIFSAEDLGQLDPGFWDVIEAGDTGRLCKHLGLLRRIDRPRGSKPPDGILSQRELRNFYRFSARREELRRMVVRHRSEWTPGDWAEELKKAPDFAKLPATRRRRLLAQQIRPTLWWTSKVSAHAGLPSGGMVYSYHPIGFVAWYQDQLRKNAKQRAAGIESADRWQGKQAPKHLTVDAESGKEMTDAEDFYSGERGRKLTLEDLANGYPEE